MSSLQSSGLILRNISKTFGNESRAVPVLNSLSLEVFEGEFVTVIGSSGTGKTTLIRIIAGLEQANSGEILFNGRELSAGEVGYIFQKPVLYPHLSVEENILFGTKLKNFSGQVDQPHYRTLLTILGLSGLTARRPAELSGGQQQRVGIARALVRKPPLVLFDEPLASVDESMSAQIRTEILQLHAGLGFTALYITHDLNEALQLGDRVAVMTNGTIVQCSTSDRLLAEPATLSVAELTGQPALNKLFVQTANGKSSLLALRSSSIGVGKAPSHANTARILIDSTCTTVYGHLVSGILQDDARWATSSKEKASVARGQGIKFFADAKVGELVDAWVESSQCHLFDADNFVIKAIANE